MVFGELSMALGFRKLTLVHLSLLLLEVCLHVLHSTSIELSHNDVLDLGQVDLGHALRRPASILICGTLNHNVRCSGR